MTQPSENTMTDPHSNFPAIDIVIALVQKLGGQVSIPAAEWDDRHPHDHVAVQRLDTGTLHLEIVRRPPAPEPAPTVTEP